jgi:gluconokinase
MPTQKSFRSDPMPRHRHLFIVTGPAGCGKSTIAKYLADEFQFPYIEGDEVISLSFTYVMDTLLNTVQFHPLSNIEKMSAGIPLTDGDRWDWLILLREQAVKALENGASGAILTCSALKNKYRDVIRAASYNDHNVYVHFIYLRATEDLLIARVRARTGHYMKDSMVKSQFDALEEPREREHDVLSIDVGGSEEEVGRLALEAVMSVIAQDSIEPRR